MRYYEVSFTFHGVAEPAFIDVRDVVAALAGGAGFESFQETPAGLCGYVQQSLFSREELDAGLALLPFDGVEVSYTVAEAEDRDWNAEWEAEGFEPVYIGPRLVVHDGRHLPGSASGALQVAIDARLAFGTGNHQTTRLMAEAVLDTPLADSRVLDCGTGTGILAIVALLGGAAEAVAYDIDEWSVDNARHNAALNGVADRLTVLHGDASLLSDGLGRFDLVMANINRNILLADLPAMSQALKPGGTLLLSGFYTADATALTDSAMKLSLTPVRLSDSEGWTCLRLKKEK